ncbi:MAG: glycoside hydrolase family 92 protein, partial [Proteiniphilum sp.]|nr:glycoside hydrolase family 92 protein [Proteiniphilum sp.]
FQIGSPLFDRIEINLHPLNASGKKFIIETEGNTSDAYYIQSATLNGSPLDKYWIYRDELFNGGTLKLNMGAQPNEKWGVE